MKSIYCTAAFLFLNIQLFSQNLSNTGYLTDDGAWCWFSDPRAIYVNGQVITGWVMSNGTVEAAFFNIEKQTIQTDELYYRLERDDHNNPAFVKTTNGTVLAMYTRHSLKDLFINVLDPDEISYDFNELST